jgi:uncharacterized protein (TIGR03437 family)
MGVNPRLIALSFSLLLTSTGLLEATPKLRLVSTTVGPVSTTTGQNGATQTVEAYNAGDGTLNLSAAANVTWLTPTVAASTACAPPRSGACLPIRIELKTSALLKGQFTGIVTVSDPNAIDAPQTIMVTVNVGGGVPDRVDAYAAPGGKSETPFSSNSKLTVNATTTTGGGWLSVPLEAGGSFRFVYTYQVTAKATSLGEGTYSGQFVTSGSTIAAENKTVPVSLRVTSQPIVSVQPTKVSIQMMQGSFADASAAGTVNYIVVSNAGQGTLSVSGVTVNITGGGDWLKAQSIANGQFIQLNTKPGSLAPGKYAAEVNIATNAVNGAVKVPVEMEVVTTGPPVAFAGGAVNNSTAVEPGDAVAQGAIVSVYGQYFLLKDPVPNTNAQTLPKELGGTRVLVNGNPVPLYYVSDGQINFQMPYETPGGDATVQIERSGTAGNKISVKVSAVVPRVLLSGSLGIVVHGADYALVTPANPAKIGEALIVFMIGGGQTSPGATTGDAVPLSPLRYAPSPASVNFGASGPLGVGVTVDPIFAGLSPGYVGLYQVNVQVPVGVPIAPNVPLNVVIGGQRANPVYIAIQ